MAGIDLTTAQTQLDRYIAAEQAVLQGQKYEIAGRMLMRANLAEIRDGIVYWNGWVQRLAARSARRSAAIVPRPRF